ncbi:hypothetical protein A3K55_01280 [Candidatus Shapirobacteria bacterium RBG_13_44_7]|uniref:Uncharacterized protein n=1 Tax=Candidatus Shapirobacteria bacterium RBG_13_44_7 TaxID=1802149 RepID=A0A1F7SKE5_9BACT|nr:MAG: hypothetical protein A3K55_01280 [Candidatus Shapirobacteria bacterium RBG_13_44_7]
MKQELKAHLLPLLIIFLITSLVWLIAKAPYYQFIFFFSGLILGAFLLDFDHLIYWLFLNPKTEEARLAAITLKHQDFRSLLKLLESTHKKHTNLIFHHFFFQITLALTSLFVFTSSDSVFVMAILMALNLHILVDEIVDYRSDKNHLRDWLFARETKQLPLKYLGLYITVFCILATFFFLILVQSQI